MNPMMQQALQNRARLGVPVTNPGLPRLGTGLSNFRKAGARLAGKMSQITPKVKKNTGMVAPIGAI